MKNSFYKLLLISSLFLFLNSCNDDKNELSQSLKGTYKGTFSVEYIDGDTYSNPVAVSFNGENNYESSANNDYFPAEGSGTYQKGISTITFHEPHHWTANFDWNLILEGEYNYSLNGNKLIIFAQKSEFGLYKYELQRE